MNTALMQHYQPLAVAGGQGQIVNGQDNGQFLLDGQGAYKIEQLELLVNI
jgi:hypothetical protein